MSSRAWSAPEYPVRDLPHPPPERLGCHAPHLAAEAHDPAGDLVEVAEADAVLDLSGGGSLQLLAGVMSGVLDEGGELWREAEDHVVELRAA